MVDANYRVFRDGYMAQVTFLSLALLTSLSSCPSLPYFLHLTKNPHFQSQFSIMTTLSALHQPTNDQGVTAPDTPSTAEWSATTTTTPTRSTCASRSGATRTGSTCARRARKCSFRRRMCGDGHRVKSGLLGLVVDG